MATARNAAPQNSGDKPADRLVLPARTMGSLRRYTLVLLRWGAIGGQALALLIVSLGLGFPVPLLACATIIGISIIFNFIITFALPLDRRVSDSEAALQLGFDILQLAALLWLTGGITNPFALLFLAPVVTSATTLSKPVLTSLATLAIILSFGLLFTFQPLPWLPEGSFSLPFTFRLGIWIAIIVGSIFTSLYAWRVTRESRKMSAALAATESMLAQEQKLSALGGLAAAAAHELGTPLATIQITAKEMTRELDPKSPLGEDAALMLSQAIRCRDILEQLSLRGDAGDDIHNTLTPEDLLEEAAEPFIHRDKDIIITIRNSDPQPTLRRQSELLYALKNYIENAVDFSKNRVELSAHWNEADIIFEIDDDGPGIDPMLKDRLGQPYVTSRRGANNAGGLGLGVFISSTLIERTGGKVFYEKSPLGGARFRAIWPLALISK